MDPIKQVSKMSLSQFSEFLVCNKHQIIAFGSIDGNTVDGVDNCWKIDETRYQLSKNYKVSFVRSPNMVQHFYITDLHSLLKQGVIILQFCEKRVR